jgi:quinoprotein glucose dehydrogenase
MGTTDARLIAIDARTGQRCAGFGGGGEIDLLEGLRDVEPQEYKVNSPPTLIGDIVAVGASISDKRRADAPPGVIRGSDARSGALSDSLWQKVWGRSRDILEHHP